MHWAGFLVVGAATRLPRHTPSQPASAEGVVSEAEAKRKQAVVSSDLAPWLRSLGLSDDESMSIMLHFRKPEYEITNLATLEALGDQDLDEVLKDLSLGKKRLLKKALTQK